MKSMLQLARTPSVTCLGSGLLLGQIVLAMAEAQDHRLVGFGYAAIFVLAMGAALVSVLRHQHVQQGHAARTAPVCAWLVMLGVAVVVSIRWTA